jgi:hypothetical protein
MSADLPELAEVRRLRRLRRMTREVREKRSKVSPLRHHSLLKLIPSVSPLLRSPDHLAPIAEVAERALAETVEVCFSVPPRHGKTTLLIHLIVWILLQDPTATILYCSYAHGFASKQVRKAMRIAQRAGVTLGDVRRRDEWTTAKGGGVKAAGVGGQITGEGFRLIIVDDPHKNRAEASSRRIRERVVAGFRDDIYTRQDPRGTSVIVCHTRWDEHDLTGELTRIDPANDDTYARPFGLINIPAIRASAANDGTYEALAPTLFPIEKLLRIRARVGEFSWASLYMGAPRPRGGLLFGDVTLIETLSEEGAWRFAIGLDIAHSARTRSDWNVAVVMRVEVLTRDAIVAAAQAGLDAPRPHFDVVEVLRRQGTLTDRVEGRGEDPKIDDGFLKELHALCKRYPGVPVVMYAAKDETLIVSLAARHDTYPVRIRAKLAISDKWTRAQPFATAWNDPRGLVRLPRHARWVSGFVAEHVAFTGAKGERDDQVDAAAAAFDALVDIKSGRGAKPQGTGEGSEAQRVSGGEARRIGEGV